MLWFCELVMMCAVNRNLHLFERILLPTAWQQTVLVLCVAACCLNRVLL